MCNPPARTFLILLFACLTLIAPTRQLSAQSAPDFSGVWILDLDRTDDVRDMYGEIRVIRQTEKQISLTMVDYGAAFVDGAYRKVVRLVPWTFRFGRWGPRRGPADSKQPRTRAEWSGQHLVLAKSTFSGNGEFVWVWDRSDRTLTHIETRKTWDNDFQARPAEGIQTYFLSTHANDPALLSLGAKLKTDIVVNVTEDISAIQVQCPTQNCTVVILDNGTRVGSRPLPKGQMMTLPLESEVIIQPGDTSK
jgi:hypothetical protein